MKAVIKPAPGAGAEFVTDFPDPRVAADEILVEIQAASVCGSDRSMYAWDSAAQGFITSFPRVLGHEGAGIVSEIGSAVTGFEVGDRVALDSHAPCGVCYQCRIGNGHNCNHMKLLAGDMNGIFAQRVAVPATMAFRLPEGMPFEIGALLEPAGVGWHAIQRADKPVAGNVIVVSGCGPIGLLIIEYCNLLGAAEVIGIEPNEFRRSLAEQRGATVFPPGAEVEDYINSNHTYRGGADLVFEVSGVAGTYDQLFSMLRRNGTFVAVGHAADPVSISIMHTINKKEISLLGIYGRLLWSTWEDLALLLQTRRLDLSWLITDRRELGDLSPVIDLLNGRSNKVILHPNGVPAA